MPKISAESILELEFTVSQAIGFHFTVHHGLRPLHGFFLDIQAALPSVSIEELGKLHDEARRLVLQSSPTDALFLYAPSQIALSGLDSLNPELTASYLALRLPEPQVAPLKRILDEVKVYLPYHAPSVEEVKNIDMKLYICRNPEHIAGSEVWQRHKEEADAATQARHAEKAAAAQSRKAADDVFGGAILP